MEKIDIEVEEMPKHLCRQDKRELKVLAFDFGLLERKEVKEIIETCKSYHEGHRKILEVYNRVYM